MPTTPNKGYSVQTTGTNSGTWGDNLNNDMISIVDNNIGGIVSKSLSSSNVTLNSTESQAATVRLSGSILANIQITTSCIGFFFVENLTTGNFTVTVRNAVSATGVAVPGGMRATILSDGTNGCRIVGNLGFVSGTSQAFFNASVPTGWTKSTSTDNGTMRIVSGTGGGTGGSANFTSVFAARTILQANIPNYNLSVTDPGHDHSIPNGGSTTQVNAGSNSSVLSRQIASTTGTKTTGISVNSAGSGTAMDFAVKYADAVIGVVN